jgi:hypothetical protein
MRLQLGNAEAEKQLAELMMLSSDPASMTASDISKVADGLGNVVDYATQDDEVLQELFLTQ